MMLLALLQLACLASVCFGFQHKQPFLRKVVCQTQPTSVLRMAISDENGRRKFLVNSFAATAMVLLSFQQSAMAIPMASVDEFETILKDSPLSIQVVEFSGPRSETVVVKLLDGTVFGIKDVVESATDPRSPLKVSAACREANVKTKFVDFEAILAGSPKKKKIYTNERVQKAYELQAAQKERIRLDELDRLAQLAKMEEQEKAMAAEAAAAASAASSITE